MPCIWPIMPVISLIIAIIWFMAAGSEPWPIMPCIWPMSVSICVRT